MLKKYIGKNRAENLEWLSNVWLKDGPPVCFLQGFSGVGKTDLARDLRDLAEKQGKWKQAVINEIADRATPSVIESLMELSATLSRQDLPEMEAVLFGEANPNLAFALEKALQRPVLIILDEAQRFFEAGDGSPLPEMNGILSFLRNRPKLEGRLLLLSDRLVENAKWSEWIPKRTLTKLEPEEAIEALENKLKDSGLELVEALGRKQELVKSLDYNPRAIESLVGALAYDSLDEIYGSKPGLWDTGDRVVSREFLHALERDLLERTLKHLDMAYQKKLWRLAVHRRSFKREALEKIFASKDEAAKLRAILVTRYLINFRSGALSLNPIVREIALDHLKEEPADCKQAHSGAADYYLRHFKAKQIVGSQAMLGESFAEARYHLVQAKRETEIRDIGHRFTDHLKREISAVSPVPTNAEELDERIGVLAVLVEDGGARGLEEHLARCLQSRQQPGDLKKAVVHAERATGPQSSGASWYLRAELENKVAGIDAAMRTIYEAIHKVSVDNNLFSLFQLGAELLDVANRRDEAVVLLKEGIKVIPSDKNLFSLYAKCAEIIAKDGRQLEDAINLLREALLVIPVDKGASILYTFCVNLMVANGQQIEAMQMLKEGIKVIPPDKNLFSLYQISADLLAKVGKTDEAVALLKEGIKVIPPDKNLFSLYQISADLLAKVGKTDEAVALLKEGIKVIPPDKSLSSLYEVLSETYCRASKLEDAIEAMREGRKRISEQFASYRVTEALLYLCAASDDEAKLNTALSATGSDALTRQAASLGAVLQFQMRGNWQAAAASAKTARQEFPRYVALASVEAFSRLASGDAHAAWESLTSFTNLTFAAGNPVGWLVTFIHLRRDARPEASASLATYLGRSVDDGRELNESFLLRLWDQQEIVPEGSRLCFFFPNMPASLTGLKQAVRRVQFGKSVLPVEFAMKLTAHVPSAPVAGAPPEIYVSYAWGEDSTETGRQREEIVDRLCDTVKQSGRIIGRDKDRMRGGDSIERFAHEISKAKRIVAVISEKSLNSEFCMAHELFRAFRRCDYQRAEFQEKVIAVVMDDAKPLLKDNLALVALAKAWQERMEKLRAELQSVDSTRKSPALWLFVDMMEDMCPRLPDMLGALKDIVMKRGFEEITKDGFKEVINRLAPATGS